MTLATLAANVLTNRSEKAGARIREAAVAVGAITVVDRAGGTLYLSGRRLRETVNQFRDRARDAEKAVK